MCACQLSISCAPDKLIVCVEYSVGLLPRGRMDNCVPAAHWSAASLPHGGNWVSIALDRIVRESLYNYSRGEKSIARSGATEKWGEVGQTRLRFGVPHQRPLLKQGYTRCSATGVRRTCMYRFHFDGRYACRGLGCIDSKTSSADASFVFVFS